MNEPCDFARQQQHERLNQSLHDLRRQCDPDHGKGSPCWCCCFDCEDMEPLHVRT